MTSTKIPDGNMCFPLINIRYVADLEKAIVSVERIREYQNTPVEAAPLRLKDFF